MRSTAAQAVYNILQGCQHCRPAFCCQQLCFSVGIDRRNSGFQEPAASLFSSAQAFQLEAGLNGSDHHTDVFLAGAARRPVGSFWLSYCALLPAGWDKLSNLQFFHIIKKNRVVDHFRHCSRWRACTTCSVASTDQTMRSLVMLGNRLLRQGKTQTMRQKSNNKAKLK